jgi:dihydropteroate synthase
MWNHVAGSLALDRPIVLGIVNVTPDSFSDGGRLLSIDAAVQHARTLVDEGADIVDVGGESTRPQAASVALEEELRRVVPVIEAIRAALPGVPISVDTVKSEVAARALEAGAAIVNDVSGFRLDARMAKVCADRGAGVVLMHSRGDVADMATFTHANYGADVVGEVAGELAQAVERATRAGVARERIVIDPGIGFAKRSEHSLAVLAGLPRLVALGYPVMVGASRKRFIGEVTGVAAADERGAGSVGAHVGALDRGAMLFRVHDVRVHRQALDVAWAIAGAGAGPGRA